MAFVGIIAKTFNKSEAKYLTINTMLNQKARLFKRYSFQIRVGYTHLSNHLERVTLPDA